MSWKPEVLVEGEWSTNAMAFATQPEAERWAADLLTRWLVPIDSRAVESDEQVNFRLDLETGMLSRVLSPAEIAGIAGMAGMQSWN